MAGEIMKILVNHPDVELSWVTEPAAGGGGPKERSSRPYTKDYAAKLTCASAASLTWRRSTCCFFAATSRGWRDDT